ncbi:restriction endonuclease subunit S [Staphylococcus condimenti]|uniref:restriction endonuclease subunit S n=1 Tax=Staphylococcus condimenti TaxID=70255 RepID=UPI0019503F04|nr:restriction endonuclease subunit S [Staphylococcus condimenti]QRP95272.1 restriction endonuclease subunit S [Staphylococcus condimenti]
MTNEIKNIPQLRFPNFDGDWEECKLEEISDKVTEKNKNNQFSETLTNSAEYGVISQRDFFDKDISNEKNLNGYYIVQEDDFVYNPRISNFAPVGPIKRNKLGRTGVMSPLYYVFRTRNIDVVFLDYYFETTGWHKFMKLNGDSGARADRFAIKDLIFKTMPIPYPIIEEQEKIGNFFSKLDRQIELEEQKLAKLEEQKKGYMQKIFSQEIRFKDDNGNDYPEWESKKFLDIYKLVPSKNNQIKSSEVVENGIIPVVDQGKDIFLGYSNEKDKAIEDFDNVIVYGDHTTIIKYIKEPFIIGGDGVKLLESNDGSLIHYLYILLQYFNVKPEGYKRHYSILKNKMMNISITKEEQEKIGNFFTKFDELIEKQNQKIDGLKKRKKGFLQKMFI